jgi:hypothetical protein
MNPIGSSVSRSHAHANATKGSNNKRSDQMDQKMKVDLLCNRWIEEGNAFSDWPSLERFDNMSEKAIVDQLLLDVIAQGPLVEHSRVALLAYEEYKKYKQQNKEKTHGKTCKEQ